MEKFKVSYLETMVSWCCNLSCIGCTNFCDYPHKGFPDWNCVEEDLKGWSSVIEPEIFSLMGGEPLLNPSLDCWIDGVRRIFPNCFLMLITNGILLEKNIDILRSMMDHAPAKILITLHKDEEKIMKSVQSLIKTTGMRFIKKDKHEPLVDLEYLLFSRNKQFSIHMKETDAFTKRYQGYGRFIFPYDTKDMQAAFNICVDRPFLYHGKIYRCGKIPLVKKTLELTGQIALEKEMADWKTCFDYSGIHYRDDYEKMSAFFEKLHKAESVCMTCPCVEDDCSIKHKENVYSKKEWLEKFWFTPVERGV